MNISLLQPNPRTGDYTANLKRLVALCTRIGVEANDLLVLPLGSLEGAGGSAAFRFPDAKAAFEAMLDAVPDQLPARRVLIFHESTLGTEYVYYEDGVRCLFSSDRAFVVDGIRIALRADNPGDILIVADRYSPAENRTELPEKSARPTFFAGIAGGQDRRVYAGDTAIVTNDSRTVLPAWDEGALRVSLEDDNGVIKVGVLNAVDAGHREVASDWRYEAIRAALRDYVKKSGVEGIVLGLSGGIDSALTASIARDAVGAERVRVLRLPSKFTSTLSNESALELARRQGLTLDTLPIEYGFTAFETTLSSLFKGLASDVTEENIQARVRGTLLMAVANKFNLLLLCNANKAESAMGYSTLYGDQTGGLAPIADLWKSDVVALCRSRNANPDDPDVIPIEIIEREPSAELRENQKDSDSLPPYDAIETVLQHVLEGGSLQQLQEVDAETARRIVKMTMRASFKREQAVPGVVLTKTPLSLIADWGMNTGAQF